MTQIQRFHLTKRYSEAAIYNKVVYLAGQVGLIDKLLSQANSDKSRILSCQIFLADMKDYVEMNRAWDEWVAPNNAPPRACVEAKLADPKWKVEIVVTAAIK